MAKTMEKPERLAIREITRRLNQTNTAKQFGFLFREIGPGRVVVGMRVSKRHLQVHGVVHGGILAALADTAGGMAVYLRLPPNSRVATVEMKINYLEAVADGEVVANAELVRLGRNLAVVVCDLLDDSKRIVAKALMTFAIISRGRKQEGRPV
jgi:acyl-CoA thioesterase